MTKDGLDTIKVHTGTITQNFPIIHHSIYDCLEIIPDMDRHLCTIRETFGLFLGNEVDLFCDCVKAGLYYELNALDSALETITNVQSILRSDTRLEIRFGIFMILSQILYAMGRVKESEGTQNHFLEQIRV